MEENLTQQAAKEAERALSEALADKYVSEVSNRLNDMETVNAPDMKRWAWELIQNAKDSIAASDKNSVQIRFKIKNNTMEFTHDGAPFTHKARIALMYKHSTGKDNHQTTGRFGTGFLTTHWLSKIVDIKSNVVDSNGGIVGFKTTLYRDGHTQDDLRKGLDKMVESCAWTEPQDWTSFTYHISDKLGEESLKLGIQSFYEQIAPTMIFCPQISSVTFDENGNITTITRGDVKDLSENIKEIQLIFRTEDETQIKRYICAEGNADLEDNIPAPVKVIVQVDTNNNIISHGYKCGFFCCLPLEGVEEQLDEPFIINAERFEPTTERQRIRLKGEIYRQDGSLSPQGKNKKIYEIILNLFGEIAAFFSNNKYGALYLMAKGLNHIKGDEKELDKDWYRKNIQAKYRDTLIQLPLINTLSGDFSNLSQVIIIKDSSLQSSLYRLVSLVYPDEVITNNDEWASVIWNDNSLRVWGLKEFCKHISETYTNWNQIPLSRETSLSEWYNQFLSLIKDQNEVLLAEFNLLPDMNGNLHKKDDKLRQNTNVSIQALEIIKKLGKDKYPELLHPDISAIEMNKEYTTQSAAAEINELVSEAVKQSGWISKLAPLIGAVPTDTDRYPNQPGFCEKREKILSIINQLYERNIEKVEENSLIAESWRKLDECLINSILGKLNDLKSLSALPEGLDAEWLNETLLTIQPSQKQWDEYAVLPNQYGNFKLRNSLYTDDNIDPVLKDSVFKNIAMDIRTQLFDPAIDAPALGRDVKKTSTDVVGSIIKELRSEKTYSNQYSHLVKDRFYKYPKTTLLLIARYIVGLLPKNKDSEVFELQDKFRAIVDIFGEGMIPYIGEIESTDNNFWAVADKLVAEDIIDSIVGDGLIENLNKRIGSIGFLKIYDLLNDLYSSLRSLNIQFSHFAIFPNQEDKMCLLKDLFSEATPSDELLKDIAMELPEGKNYRAVLLNHHISYPLERVISREQMAEFIDGRVISLYNNEATKQNEDFKCAVRNLIEEWAPKNLTLFNEKCKETAKIKDSIIVNVILPSDLRAEVYSIASENPALIKQAKENARRVTELEKEVAELKAQLEAQRYPVISPSAGDNGLSREEMEIYRKEAEQRILLNLEEEGFDISNATTEWTSIKGVVKRDSNEEFPIVFRSNKMEKATVINAPDWTNLMKKNAMFGIVTSDGNVRKYKMSDLIRNTDYLTIRFSTMNCDISERLDKLAEALRFFKGLQFDFGKFIEPTLQNWEPFCPPLLMSGEKPEVGSL